MAEKPIKWNLTCNRFVAFQDIMGFKDRLQREGHEKIEEMLETLRFATQAVKSEIKIPELQEIIKSRYKGEVISLSSFIHPIMFSDSIITISRDDSDISAFLLLGFITTLQCIAFEKAIPMKGAIACGKMTANIDESLFFGEPLIDAFKLQQELQLYGVVLHHTCEVRINDPDYFKDPELMVSRGKGTINYHVPMKSGKIAHCLVNWVYPYENENIPAYKRKNPINSISKLYDYVSGKPRIYVDNTLEFLNWIKPINAELKKKKNNKSI
jgi:hypothetical protein